MAFVTRSSDLLSLFPLTVYMCVFASGSVSPYVCQVSTKENDTMTKSCYNIKNTLRKQKIMIMRTIRSKRRVKEYIF